jgi:hypothetical protein
VLIVTRGDYALKPTAADLDHQDEVGCRYQLVILIVVLITITVIY